MSVDLSVKLKFDPSLAIICRPHQIITIQNLKIKAVLRLSETEFHEIIKLQEVAAPCKKSALTVVKDRKVKIAITGAAREKIMRTFRTLVLSAP